MASTANSLRLGLRGSSSQIARLQTGTRPSPPAAVAVALAAALRRRCLSTMPPRWAADGKDAEAPGELELEFSRNYANPGEFLADYLRKDTITRAERQQAARMLEQWKEAPAELQGQYEQLARNVYTQAAPLKRPVQPRKNSFWNAEEKDTDLITDEVGEDDFEEDDILSMGHGKLEEHREAREYSRVTVWEMPLLSKFAKPFVPPTGDEVLRFRYTTYMGEFHPADRKVVVEFCPKDLRSLTDAQQLKLKKLAGPRYNPEKDIIKMSCEIHEHQAQNKRHLGDMIDRMIATAKDPTDMFEDIPLDTRHHTFTVKPKFPKEWRMTEERRKELEAIRQEAFRLDEARRTGGGLVDGVVRIQEALAAPQAAAAELQPVMARRGGARPGKQNARPQPRR
ncbi:mitochondrial ribosomal subunit protein-domain-containing protein [Podospora appendiculata]|uniref:Mitochondrial ribosomal subunit protein-domain-containing protein n=1 Tax=Podospora appendiculata TaxID=314037 RepID=A0AAE1C7S3_9PEZI|nr:mitochondrial ribosomal subunit protein-domain-containing protein [Podospora appendiculata]